MIIDKVMRFKIKGNPEASFKSMDEYINLAKKQISFYSRKTVRGSLLKDEDAISYIAYANMLADWRYDPSKGVSPRTYRDNYAIGFIKTLTSKNYRNKNILSVHKGEIPTRDSGMVSLDETISNKDEFNLLDVFIDNPQKLNQKWNEEDIQSCIENLPERDKKILKMYVYEDKNFAEIGRELSITRERVRQIVKGIMIIIKKELEDAK